MIKLNLFCLLLTLSYFGSYCYGQLNFSERIVSTDALGARDIYAADLDEDGDMDLLSSSRIDGHLSWFENTDGNGSFNAAITISTEVSGEFVLAGDIDGDGDPDVLSANQSLGRLTWFENTDGQGSFGAPNILGQSTLFAWSAFIADMDNDGDLDLISAAEPQSPVVSELAWYENLDGQGNFGSKNIIYDSLASNPESVFASDLDGDGDLDVLLALGGADSVFWFENLDSEGNFGPEQTIASFTANNATAVHAEDLDGDGDMDVLSASWGDNKIAWYENMDGQGTFSSEIIITDNALGAWDLYTSDIDGDEDPDIVFTAAIGDRVGWIENTNGMGTFGPQNIITNNPDGPLAVYTTDIDNDTDMDILVASLGDNTVAWYENLRILEVKDSHLNEVDLAPNPVKQRGVFQIPLQLKIDVIKILNHQGVLLSEISVSNDYGILETDHLPTGLYFYQVFSEEKLLKTEKFIVK
ncbi:MAG: T9SS type A sorting domain-containing protein [Bacteroidota bacterium]